MASSRFEPNWSKLNCQNSCLSQLTDPFQFLLPPDSLLKSYQKSTSKFIWNSAPKVKNATTIAPFSQGGLKIIDIKSYASCLRIAWLARVRRVEDPDLPGWRQFLNSLLKPFEGVSFLACNYNMKFFPRRFPLFYKKALADWFSFTKKPGHPLSVSEFSQIIIWNNQVLLIDQKPFFFPDWARVGIFYLGRIFEPDGSFLSFTSFRSRFGNISCLDWFRFGQIRDCIPAQWRITFLKDFSSFNLIDFTIPPIPKFFNSGTSSFVNLSGQRSQVYYQILSRSLYIPPKSADAWSRDLGILDIIPYFR